MKIWSADFLADQNGHWSESQSARTLCYVLSALLLDASGVKKGFFSGRELVGLLQAKSARIIIKPDRSLQRIASCESLRLGLLAATI